METQTRITKRRENVLALLDRADHLVQEGKINEADSLRADTSKRFGSIRDLKELVQKRTGIDVDAKKAPKDSDDSPEG